MITALAPAAPDVAVPDSAGPPVMPPAITASTTTGPQASSVPSPTLASAAASAGTSEEERMALRRYDVDDLRRLLFGPASAAYAVLDGARVRGLPQKLHEFRQPAACLLTGPLPPDLTYVAPYLVRLSPDGPFTAWLLDRGWGHSWGMMADLPAVPELAAAAQQRAVLKHVRSLMTVHGPDGQPLRFRFYDPRVLRVYLPTCTADEAALVFGPARRLLMEDASPDVLLEFVPGRRGPELTSHVLAPVRDH